MTAKDAIFEEMGWAEDAIRSPMTSKPTPSMGPTTRALNVWKKRAAQPTSRANMPSTGGSAGSSAKPGSSGDPMSELEKHDKESHKGGYKGGKCKFRAEMAAAGIDVGALDKQRGLPAPENGDYGDGEGENDEESDVAGGTGGGESKTPEGGTPLEHPEKVDVGGTEVTAMTDKSKGAAEILNEVLNDPNVPDAVKAKCKEALERLSVNPATSQNAQTQEMQQQGLQEQVQQQQEQHEQAIEQGKELNEELSSEAGQLDLLVKNHEQAVADIAQQIQALNGKEPETTALKNELVKENNKFQKDFEKIDTVATNEAGEQESPEEHAKHCKANPKSNCPFLKGAMTPEQLQQLDAQESEHSSESSADNQNQENNGEGDVGKPISDEEYEKWKDSDEVKEYKRQLTEWLSKGGNVDPTGLPKGSIEERVFNEVIEERKAAGQKVEEYTDKVKSEEVDDIPFPEDTPSEEPPKEEQSEQKENTERPQSIESPNASHPGLLGKRDWTPAQKAALAELSQKFGNAVNGIKKDVSDTKFSKLLSDITHFDKVRGVWQTTPNVSEERSDVREAITGSMDNHTNKSFKEQVVDEIDSLIGNNAVPKRVRLALQGIKDTLASPVYTKGMIDNALKQYDALCSRHGLDEIIENGSENRASDYLEDNDENHRNGGVVSSKGEYKDWKVDVNSLPDEKEGNGSVNNADEIKEKIFDDLSKKNFPVDIDDIKETNFISTTDFSFKFPKDTHVSKSMISTLKQEIARNFPLAEDKGLSINYNNRTDTLTVTVENDNRGYVSHKRMLQSKEFQDALQRGEIPIALGLDDKGKPIVANLPDMVHVLLAGATNSGKSARLGSILTSLLMQSPDDLKMILIDPKKVEFESFKGDPHLIGDVITEGQDAIKRLNYLVNEQENRYRLFGQAGVRNLKEYNEKGKQGLLPKGMPTKLPAITLVIDEFADLMDTNGKDIEGLVKRLGQKSRAAGVHLVLATQRPTAKNIPTDIRANIPTTIGMNVRDWRESGYVGIEGLDKLPQKGPLVIKTPDGKTTKVDGSYINGDGITQMVGLSRGNAKNNGGDAPTPPRDGGTPSPETNDTSSSGNSPIDTIGETPQEKAFLNLISDRVTSGNEKPFTVPSDKADKVKKTLEAQGYGYTEMPAANGKVQITPKKKETPLPEGNTNGEGLPKAGAEGQQTGEKEQESASQGETQGAEESQKGQNLDPNAEARSKEKEGLNPDLADEYDQFHKEFDESVAKTRKNLANKKAAGKARSSDYDNARSQETMAIEALNQWRERNGLPLVTGVDKNGNVQYATQEEEPAEQEGGEANGEATTATPGEGGEEPKEKPLTREEYEAKYPQTREGQMQRIADERKEALNDKWRELSEKGLSPALIQQDKGYQKLVQSYKDAEADINERFPEPKEEENASGQEESKETTAPENIVPKDDVSKLDPMAKRRYDAAVRRFNSAINAANEGLDNDKLTDEQYTDAIKAATEALNKTRTNLGFTTPVKSDGVFEESQTDEQTPANAEQTPAEEEPAKPEPIIPRVDAPENEPTTREDNDDDEGGTESKKQPPKERGRISRARMVQAKKDAMSSSENDNSQQGGFGFASRNDEDDEQPPVSSGEVTPPPKNPEPQEGSSAAETLKSEAAPEDKAEAAMKMDKGIKALQDALNKATKEHGENSPEAKKAARNLKSAQTRFKNAFALTQEPDGGVKDVRTKKPEQTAPATGEQNNKGIGQPAPEAKKETPADNAQTETSKPPKEAKKKPVRKEETSEKATERKSVAKKSKETPEQMQEMKEELDKVAKADPKMQALHSAAQEAAAKHGKGSPEHTEAKKKAKERLSQLGNAQTAKKARATKKMEGKGKKETPAPAAQEEKALQETKKTTTPSQNQAPAKAEGNSVAKETEVPKDATPAPKAENPQPDTTKETPKETTAKAVPKKESAEPAAAKPEAPAQKVKTKAKSAKAEKTAAVQEPKQEAKAEAKPVPKPEAKAEAKPDTKAEAGKSRDDRVRTVAEMYQEGLNLGTKTLHPMNIGMARELVDMMDKKDFKKLTHKLRIDNELPRKAFEKLTGKKLPPTKAGTNRVIEEFCKEGGEQTSVKRSESPKEPDKTKTPTVENKSLNNSVTQPKKDIASPKPKPATPTNAEANSMPSSATTTSTGNENISDETPQMKAYREKKEAEAKAKAEEQAKKDAERRAKLAQAQRKVQQNQGNSRGLNNQRAEYEANAMEKVDRSKIKGIKTLSEMRAPEKVDNESANELNSRFDEVNAEIQSLADKLKKSENDGSLSKEETQQAVGQIGHLRKEIMDMLTQKRLGANNFTFERKVDQSGNLMGVRISSYRDADGNYKKVTPIKKKRTATPNPSESQNTPSSNDTTSKQPPHQAELSFGEEDDVLARENTNNAALRKRLEEIRAKRNKGKGTATKDEALNMGIPTEDYYWVPVEDELLDTTNVWDEIFVSAVVSMS